MSPRARWTLRAYARAAAAALFFILLAEFAPETPLSEALQMAPAVALSFLAAGAPARRHACAPCGCAGDAVLAAACIGDAELARFGALDGAPRGPPAAAAAAAALSDAPALRLGTEQCHALLTTAHAAAAARGGGAPGVGPILFHIYWKPDTNRGFQAAHVAAAEAFLVTQPANATLVIWVPVPQAAPAALAALARAFPARVRLRALDILWEAEGSPLARSYLLRLTDKYSWIDSDITRYVLLWRYGGVYIDADLLLLRDVSPLLGVEFVTQFSCDEARGDGGINGAVMRLFARGRSATALLELSRAATPRLAKWTYGPWLLEKFRAAGADGARLRKLPWCFFHGLWCGGALARDALVGATPWPRALVDGPFGVHMHGAAKSGEPIAAGSVLGVKMRENRAALVARLGRELPPFPEGRELPWAARMWRAAGLG